MPIYNQKKIVSAYLQIFQLMLGQKNLGAQHGMSYRDLCCLYLYISVLGGDIHRHLFLDPSLPLLKSGQEKLRARVLVNSFSMDEIA